MFTLTPVTRTQLTRRNPQFTDTYRLLNNFFNDDFFKSNLIDNELTNSQELGFDIQETDTSYILEADLPGVAREEINIEYKDNSLTIDVSSKKDSEESNVNYIRRERSQKTYRRSFLLENIQSDLLTAKLENGVLTIVAPKSEKIDTSIKIEVQ